MAGTSQSREPKGKVQNLADVANVIRSDEDIEGRKKSDYVSALNKIAKILDRRLDEIPADTKLLSRRLADINPTQHGLKKQSWANVKSHLRKALVAAGVPVATARNTKGLALEWQQLRDLVPAKPHGAALSNFMGYCTRKNIKPDDMSDEVLADYYKELCDFGLLRREKAAYRNAAKFWNKSAAEHPNDWPQIELTVPKFKDVYSLGWDSFPGSFQQDIDTMVAAATGVDLLSERHMRIIKPASANQRAYQLRRLASGAVHKGIDAARISSIANLCEVDIAKAGLRFLLDRNDGKPSKSIHALMRHLCCVAREWVEVDQGHLDELIRLKNNLNPGNLHQMTEKNRDLVRIFDDRTLLKKLVRLPTRIIKQVAAQKHIRETDAVRAQAALAIQIVLLAPMRLKNFASISLGTHLVQLGSGNSKQYYFQFPEDQVKNKRSLAYPLPKPLVQNLEIYLDKVRPVLLRAANDYLFPGESTSFKSTSLLSSQMARLSEEELGVRITAHQYRHLAGAIVLGQNPTAHEHVRQLLGHSSIATTVNFYAPLEQDRAVRLYDEVVLGLGGNEEGRD